MIGERGLCIIAEELELTWRWSWRVEGRSFVPLPRPFLVRYSLQRKGMGRR